LIREKGPELIKAHNNQKIKYKPGCELKRAEVALTHVFGTCIGKITHKHISPG